MRLLVTGANGFVGRSLCAEALRRGFNVRGAIRQDRELPVEAESAVIDAIDDETDWADALCGEDVVIHLAARVHVMRETIIDPLVEFRRVNTAGTEHLARCAAVSGVRRLVYVSSVKVNGEETAPPYPRPDGTINHSTKPASGQVAGYLPTGARAYFSEQDAPAPQDPYGISKWEAEQALRQVAQETGLEVVIVRPPLVYGPGVKGNFLQMLKVLNRGIPLPLSAVNNLRSMIYVENLVDALLACAEQPGAAGKTYLVSDGEDISTPDLLRRLGRAMGHPARLFPLPPGLLKLGGRLLGRAGQVERLVGSLRVDSSRIRRELGWQPPYTLEQGLHATADWYRHHPD